MRFARFAAVVFTAGVIAFLLWNVTDALAAPTLGEVRVLTAVNHERTERGLVPLVFRSSLINAGRYHSADMARRNYLTHISSNGWTPIQRVRYFGYCPLRLGECIGRGYAGTIWKTPEGMVALWMGSPTHRAILLDPAFRDFGCGMRWNYTWRYFTADLGRR